MDPTRRAEPQQPTCSAAHTLVLLGASNLKRSFATAANVALNTFPRPLDVYVAHGDGRSYGLTSSAFGLHREGIRQCGLWEALNASTPQHGWAVLADVGNDVMYEVPPDELTGWVADVVDRLQAANLRVALLDLPIASLQRVSPWRFRLFKTIFFPRSALTQPLVMERVAQVRRAMHDLADRRQLPLIQQPPEWYWLDPIHIVPWRWREAWQFIFKSVLAGEHSPPQTSLPTNEVRPKVLQRLPPAKVIVNGQPRETPQPALCLPDRTSISLY